MQGVQRCFFCYSVVCLSNYEFSLSLSGLLDLHSTTLPPECAGSEVLPVLHSCSPPTLHQDLGTRCRKNSDDREHVVSINTNNTPTGIGTIDLAQASAKSVFTTAVAVVVSVAREHRRASGRACAGQRGNTNKADTVKEKTPTVTVTDRLRCWREHNRCPTSEKSLLVHSSLYGNQYEVVLDLERSILRVALRRHVWWKVERRALRTWPWSRVASVTM
jgi:hypothetical protein